MQTFLLEAEIHANPFGMMAVNEHLVGQSIEGDPEVLLDSTVRLGPPMRPEKNTFPSNPSKKRR
jgi:hypothetical protein